MSALDHDVVVPRLLVARAREAPDVVVLHDVVTDESWTHGALLEAATRWAGALRAAGVRPGDVVATMAASPTVAVRAWLGASFAGAVEAPINPQHRGPLLRGALRLVAPRILVVDDDVLADLTDDDRRAVDLVLGVGALDALARAATPVTEPPAAGPGDTGAIIFTSGTTGPSKGVVVTWAGIFQLASWVPRSAYDAGDAVYCVLPLFHAAGKSTLVNVLVRGARMVCRERFSASAFLDDVRAAGCSAASIVGPMLAFLHETPVRADDRDNPVRVVACGPLIPEIDAFEDRFGVQVMTCYGMTEMGSVLTTDADHGPWNACGRVRPDYPWPEVRVVDPDGHDVVPGAVGELVARPRAREAFSPGYLHDPETTAAAWRDGWFRSGDAVRVDADGNHYLVDRFTDTIRRRGENVSSFEVESIVASHAGVRECAAVAVPGAHGDDDIVVFVIGRVGATLDADDLRAWTDARVPSHMRPSTYHVVDDLPRNATSLRVKKYELRAMARSERSG